jgi:arylsulfatase A-like enzyme
MPLHLEEHLDAATIVGSEVPADLPVPVEWRFDEPQPDWKPAKPLVQLRTAAVEAVRADDALRLPLTARNRAADGPRLIGMIYVELPDWSLQDWGYVEIRARTRDPMRYVGIAFNYAEEDDYGGSFPFYSIGDRAFLMTDGTVQTYRLSLDWPQMRSWEGPWTHLGIWFNSQDDEEAATLDILSVRVIPRHAEFAEDRVGVRIMKRGTLSDSPQDAPYHRSLYMHTPGRIAYRVRVPENGRLDLGLGVLREDALVTFAITATQQDSAVETLLEETYTDRRNWGQRSVDLSHLAGQTVTLALDAEADRAGTVALWAAPTVSGARTTEKPNVIFYIIDGAGADYMSVYGYNRRTTPNLERIAAEGAIFERAYSNSSFTRPSTASFLTSLQHSVLGGFRNGTNPVPDQVLTMAEHMHRAGYQTAELASNPNAGRRSNLERGVDVFRDSYFGDNSLSSVSLHEDFWQWREAYPAEPYWVHFQTTDVHFDHSPHAPFAGLFISPERRRIADEGLERVYQIRRNLIFTGVLQEVDIDHVALWTAQRDLHDEMMAHQDYQLGRLVARLKAAGEWERTLLIIAADHSVAAGSMDFGLLMRDPVPPHVGHHDPATPMLRSGVSRIPLIVVWPGHIAGGQRFSQPVSMIDMLPTVLDLVDLPMPEVMQGQSLAPLLLREAGWQPRPVILDEFEVDDETGELRGRIEVVDGRWGASLVINGGIALRDRPSGLQTLQRSVPLLLYDLWNDPECLNSLHEERPDLVEKYTAFLEAQWEAHQALAELFTPSGSVALTPEQLKTLRALGYIQ